MIYVCTVMGMVYIKGRGLFLNRVLCIALHNQVLDIASLFKSYLAILQF